MDKKTQHNLRMVMFLHAETGIFTIVIYLKENAETVILVNCTPYARPK